MARKKTFEEIEKSFNDEGYELLDKVYVNSQTPLKYKCPNGHINSMRWNDWQQNHRCPNCMGQIVTLEDVEREVKKRVKEEIQALEELIRIKRKGRKGRDKTITHDGRAKNFEIKSIEDRRRRSLEGLFGINPALQGIQQNLKGKHIVIFDDNISSGATLDDICLELQKLGVASILPITLAIIPKTVYGGVHEKI